MAQVLLHDPRVRSNGQQDLSVPTLVAAVLAKIEQTPAEAATLMHTLRWSNAGHPSSSILRPDGTVEMLWRPVDRLLGVTTDTLRHDHTVGPAPGSTVLFFTDGLIERRDASLNDGSEWLHAAAEGFAEQGLTLDQLCDELVTRSGGQADDDVVILGARVHPEE